MTINMSTDVASQEQFKQTHIELYMSVGFTEERAIAIVDAAMKASNDAIMNLNVITEQFEDANESNNALGLAASLTAFRIEVLRQDLIMLKCECEDELIN